MHPIDNSRNAIRSVNKILSCITLQLAAVVIAEMTKESWVSWDLASVILHLASSATSTHCTCHQSSWYTFASQCGQCLIKKRNSMMALAGRMDEFAYVIQITENLSGLPHKTNVLPEARPDGAMQPASSSSILSNWLQASG